VEASSSARAVDDSLHSAINLDGDDLVQLLLSWLGLEQAAYGGDGGFHRAFLRFVLTQFFNALICVEGDCACKALSTWARDIPFALAIAGT